MSLRNTVVRFDVMSFLLGSDPEVLFDDEHGIAAETISHCDSIPLREILLAHSKNSCALAFPTFVK